VSLSTAIHFHGEKKGLDDNSFIETLQTSHSIMFSVET